MQHKQQNVWRLDGNALEINHWILIPLIKLLTAAPEKYYDRSDSSDFSDLLLATVSVWLLFFFSSFSFVVKISFLQFCLDMDYRPKADTSFGIYFFMGLLCRVNSVYCFYIRRKPKYLCGPFCHFIMCLLLFSRKQNHDHGVA